MAAMTPEELEEYEKSIPEWKRNALVMTDNEVKDEDSRFFSGVSQLLQRIPA